MAAAGQALPFFPSSFFSDNTGLFIGQGATARLRKGGGNNTIRWGICAGRGGKKKKKEGIARFSFLHFLFLSFFLFLCPPLSHLVEVLEKEFDQYDWQEEERKEGGGERMLRCPPSFPFFPGGRRRRPGFDVMRGGFRQGPKDCLCTCEKIIV